ncbi:MAG TPA: ABC transporter ATP-binding protein [Bryobacteraceae bacterium]|nr:ABC transporter ATP-binding protein [Bryobacteraceae bacterium]
MANELTLRCRRRLPSGFELDAGMCIPLEESCVTVLFGPSGAGKTSVLRIVAGLDRPDSGSITFRGHSWYDSARGIDLAPQQRGAAFLFQDYALFPHLTVAENVGFAARASVEKLLETFGIADLAGRLPRSLSGGQQQRVALARSLAAGPALLLLDEPLSALDAVTRARMRQDLRRLLIESGVPSIVVTHDRAEAIALGDWMAVIVDGRIRQAGPVPEVFRKPADSQVAESVGVENLLPATIVSRASGLLTLEVGAARLQCLDSGESGAVLACIRAEDVAISRDSQQHSSVRNRIPARVRSVSPEGPLARVELDCGFPVVALVTSQSAADMALKPGDAVHAIVKTTSVYLTPASGGGS